MQEVTFKNVHNKQTKDIFLKVYKKYEELHSVKLILRQTTIKGSTMQAQPILKPENIFRPIDTYKIQLATFVRDSQDLKVDELPQEVLTGWFAHELGHVIDYLRFSPIGMLGYGTRYLTSSSFQKKVEHRADEIAIENGFYKKILATKEFLLNHDMIDQKYKDKILKYYMSVENVNKLIEKNVHLHPVS